eukprot:Hpha_TRINITY_DN14982_c4_g3::TRINITY_DN14982_c4_g3_i1::g.143352::m.143352
MFHTTAAMWGGSTAAPSSRAQSVFSTRTAVFVTILVDPGPAKALCMVVLSNSCSHNVPAASACLPVPPLWRVRGTAHCAAIPLGGGMSVHLSSGPLNMLAPACSTNRSPPAPSGATAYRRPWSYAQVPAALPATDKLGIPLGAPGLARAGDPPSPAGGRGPGAAGMAAVCIATPAEGGALCDTDGGGLLLPLAFATATDGGGGRPGGGRREVAERPGVVGATPTPEPGPRPMEVWRGGDWSGESTSSRWGEAGLLIIVAIWETCPRRDSICTRSATTSAPSGTPVLEAVAGGSGGPANAFHNASLPSVLSAGASLSSHSFTLPLLVTPVAAAGAVAGCPAPLSASVAADSRGRGGAAAVGLPGCRISGKRAAAPHPSGWTHTAGGFFASSTPVTTPPSHSFLSVSLTSTLSPT